MNDSKIFFKLILNSEGNLSGNGYENIPLGGNRVRINNVDYNFTPELQTASNDTRHNLNNNYMHDENIDKILKNLGYDNTKNSNSKRTEFVSKDLEKRVDKYRNHPLAIPANENEDESDDLEGQGIETINIPSNNIDNYIRLEVLLGLKLSGHTNTLMEASILIDTKEVKHRLNNNFESLVITFYQKNGTT